MTTPRPHGAAVDGVCLEQVDEETLRELLDVATVDAAADDVTPPLSADGSWSPARIEWFLGYHRSCRGGLKGPAAEATWAVLLDGAAIGAVRLQATDEPGVVEAGIWLARRARHRGVAQAAIQELLQKAHAEGARAVRASTTVDNTGAIALLSRFGFQTRLEDNGRDVHAERHLEAD